MLEIILLKSKTEKKVNFSGVTHFFTGSIVKKEVFTYVRIGLDTEGNFFSIWGFFHERSQITGLQGKEEGISLTPHYHLHPLHRYLDIIRAITAESSPLHKSYSRPRTRNLWFPSASRSPLSYAPSKYVHVYEIVSIWSHLVLQIDYVAHFADQLFWFADQIFVSYRLTND